MNSSNETGPRQEAPAVAPETEPDKDQVPRSHDQHEVGGPAGLEPTRYGDWEKGGRCIDF